MLALGVGSLRCGGIIYLKLDEKEGQRMKPGLKSRFHPLAGGRRGASGGECTAAKLKNTHAGIKQFGGFVLKPLEINRVGIGMAVLLGGQAGNCAFVPWHGGFME